MAMFKSYKLYVQVKRNQIKVIDLDNGMQVTKVAAVPFSSVRNIIGKFLPVQETLSDALRDLGIGKPFGGIKVVIQQMEGTEGGLSDIEKRALRDVGELTGAKKVYLEEGERELTMDEAITRIG
jgi:hypothetical protein